MIETREFLLHARLETEVLEGWIEAGWLRPQRQADVRQFSEMDLARAQLIRDLKHDCGVNDEGIGVILDLLDQMHGVRRTLRYVLAAVRAQPDTMRQQILAALRAAASDASSGERIGTPQGDPRSDRQP